jgi:uncharacterized protein (DUF2235 family)
VAKNVVILSDGTGNSAANPFKTNVWRLYQAVDQREPSPTNQTRQIAIYDDGVGTENFKPLKWLGFATGLGLANNVKKLYTFLCRNYEPTDRIYLFGFSRGAFTVRILAGLILKCGLVKADSEAELNELVKVAYAEYKRDVARRATATRRALIAGQFLGGHDVGATTDHVAIGRNQVFPEIWFIGVWDTVDAYGMPVDELKQGIDRYLWPMTLADRTLSPHIRHACHALSLDDERPTFWPVLWDERGITDPDRLKQVWFAGVHRNVGGGCPDDALAHVPMQWMMDEARVRGLRFFGQHVREVDDRADLHGKAYDSRSGLAGYYRYGPRCGAELCNDEEHQVLVAKPKLHESALSRIAQHRVPYAPVGVVADYALHGRRDRRLVLLPPIELDAQARVHDMKAAWDAVFRRRVAYFATLALSLFLAAFPLLDRIGWLPSSLPGWDPIAGRLSRALEVIFKLAAALLPSWTAQWFASFAAHPAVFIVAAGALLWLFVRKSDLIQQEVFARAEYAWRGLVSAPAAPRPNVPPPGRSWTDSIARGLRTNRFARALHFAVAWRLVPFLFAIFVAAPVGLLILPFFIPKFVRNAMRRRKHRVRLVRTERIERVRSEELEEAAAVD